MLELLLMKDENKSRSAFIFLYYDLQAIFFGYLFQ